MLFNLPRHYCHPILQGEKPRHQKVTRDLTNLIQLAGGEIRAQTRALESPELRPHPSGVPPLLPFSRLLLRETPLGRVAGPPEGPINHSALAEPGTLFTWRSLLPPQILAAFSRGEILGLRPPSSRKEKHLGSSTFLMLMLGRSAVRRGGRAVTASIFSAICQEYFKRAILVRAVLCTCNCSTTGSWETKGTKWIFWGVFVCLFVYVKCCELVLQPPFK